MILVVIAADQTVILINKRGCEILGYDENEIVGQNWFEGFIPRQNRDQVVATFKQLVAGDLEPIEYFENPVLTASGQERMIAWHNTVLRDPSGRITGALSSGEDITERIQAEQALRDSEERFRGMVENLPGAVYRCANDADWTMHFISEPIGDITGYPATGLLSSSTRDTTIED